MTARAISRPGAVAMLTIVVGAAGSLYLMLRVGSRNPSVLLMLVFAVWVVAPFVGLFFLHRRSALWPVPAVRILYGVTLAITLGSLFIYQRVLTHQPRKPAFPFLVVPLLSGVVMAATSAAASLLPRRRP